MKRVVGFTGIVVGLSIFVYVAGAQQPPAPQPPGEAAVQVADGVWFQRNYDTNSLGSNVAWIEFANFVVVIDTAFPAGAERALKSIKATTKRKPIRYAVVTHYHADHAFGTGVFAKEGTIVVAHENARRDYLGRNVEQYAERVRTDRIAARYKMHAPDVTFTDRMVIDDGKQRRAELFHFGHAHTSGCVFTWLPKEKIVFTGDATVNGPFNFLGDSDTASWIDAISQVQALEPRIVVPGHGPVGKADVLENQKHYFVELRAQVGSHVRQGKTLEEVQALVDIPAWKRWTGETKMKEANIAHVYRELTRGGPSAEGGPGLTDPVVAIPMEPGKERPKLKYLTAPLSPEQVAGLRQIAPNVELLFARNPKEALALAPEVHGMSGSLCKPEVLRVAKNLRWVLQASAGVEHLVSIPELVDNDQIVLTNARTMFGPNIGDHVFALLLSLTRGLPHFAALMKTGTWGRDRGAGGPALIELKGKTMLVVGLGGIGREVARRAHAFGMQVVATDPQEGPVPHYVARLEAPDQFPALLPGADVVVVAAPLTPRTRGLFGAAQFAAMKPSAYFINVARGGIYDNQALAAALRAGKLAGAGLDVTDPEPLPSNHPLWKAPNVIITPHVAGQSSGATARLRALLMENMRRFASGEPLLNVVDKRAGY
jgi:phosphoglycerate dehydrogenase-like enzyme/glyoxylase-like metal-dependent hydrolase (beta-lactamase superfamily II)